MFKTYLVVVNQPLPLKKDNACLWLNKITNNNSKYKRHATIRALFQFSFFCMKIEVIQGLDYFLME